MQPSGLKETQLNDDDNNNNNQKVHPQPMEQQQQQSINQNPEAMEALISNLFGNISSLKSAYIQLQSAHTPLRGGILTLRLSPSSMVLQNPKRDSILTLRNPYFNNDISKSLTRVFQVHRFYLCLLLLCRRHVPEVSYDHYCWGWIYILHQGPLDNDLDPYCLAFDVFEEVCSRNEASLQSSVISAFSVHRNSRDSALVHRKAPVKHVLGLQAQSSMSRSPTPPKGAEAQLSEFYPRTSQLCLDRSPSVETRDRQRRSRNCAGCFSDWAPSRLHGKQSGRDQRFSFDD
ncbi:hypothetical protein F2Q68_00024419 [Brassica cretica]|uniref:DUF641 domain-containing protein n=1 Tax=Brassica cretica TaxID=69181 RepID=A0A8S9IDD8_BRACR|nr:hypothetical protein F2Q68_00024419 [Brassica cretica]